MIRTFGEATIGFQKLLAEGTKLCEALTWITYCRTNKIKLQEKDLLLGDLYTYRSSIISYINDLEYYSEHYLEFDLKNFSKTKTYTTDNYFTTTVATKRERSVKTLKIIKRYKNTEEILELLVITTNNYIDLCIDILKVNPHLDYFRKKFGVEYLIKKYNLTHIELDDI